MQLNWIMVTVSVSQNIIFNQKQQQKSSVTGSKKVRPVIFLVVILSVYLPL